MRRPHLLTFGFCIGLNDTCPPWSQVFEHMVSSWWCDLGGLGLIGGDMSLEVVSVCDFRRLLPFPVAFSASYLWLTM